mmetsp:Transcript_30163/g.54655  ORF Transcript_30163/g.54655 Transcript_30163/m.54655 type:complete len:261 (-) Transcript_30163:694-1476(-)
MRIFSFLPEPLPRLCRSSPSSSARSRANGDAAGLGGGATTFFFFFWATFTLTSFFLLENSTTTEFAGSTEGFTIAFTTSSDAAAFISVFIGISSTGGLGVTTGEVAATLDCVSGRAVAGMVNMASTCCASSSRLFMGIATGSSLTMAAMTMAGSSSCTSMLVAVIAVASSVSNPTSFANTSMSNSPPSNILLNSFLYPCTPALRCEYANTNANVPYITTVPAETPLLPIPAAADMASNLRSKSAKTLVRNASSTLAPLKL